MVILMANAFLQWIKDWAAQPGRIKEIQMAGEQTTAAIEELKSAVDEVAQDIANLAAKVEAGDASDAEIATVLRGQASRLRGLQPDAPVENPVVGEQTGDRDVSPEQAAGVAPLDNNING